MRSHHSDAQSLQAGQQANTQIETGQAFPVRRLPPKRSRLAHNTSGRRTLTRTNKRGRYAQSMLAVGDYSDIAFDATLRAAAPQQSLRTHHETVLVLDDGDMHKKVRTRKNANLIVFAVDASWSMAAAERMEATKGAILSLLVDAYQKRDRVCMLTFQHERATLILPPTSSVETAHKVLTRIPVGGKTPLSAGLLMAYEVIKREKELRRDTLPMLILLTDGDGNVSITGLPPMDETLAIADLIARDQVHSLVINTEHRALDKGRARQIAERLHGQCYLLQELRADTLFQTIRRELAG